MISDLPTGTVTFLFTDIEGSTRLWQEHPEAMAGAHARHDQILREAIESNHGHVFQVVGDSFSAVFPNAIDGLHAVLAGQRALQQQTSGVSEDPPVVIRVRMGLHTGTAQVLPDGKYEGYATLASTQRVMSAAHGGQTLLTQTTYELAQNALPADVTLQDMGEHRLKDLRAPLRLYQVNAPDLPKNFPPIKSLEFQPNNLPIQLTTFIGREKEIAEIKDLLASSRLVTLTGSGGTGKTRLSVKVGTQELSSYPDGVWMLELASLSEPEQIMPALAKMLGLQESLSSPPASLVSGFLQAKELLLILDNCEHLVAACAGLADDLLHACPGLKLLANSREALDISGEMVYRIPPLAETESSRLFAERARAANARFSLTDANAAAVAQICSRLDGIPLAIELAAARTKLLSADQIAAHLDDRFKLLTGGSRNALPRQQTLRALIDWSYDLLSAEERALLRRLSVFSGGWTFQAAEFVCPDHDVLDLLSQLVNKSLVIVDEQDDGSMRYHLLETIRQYAQDKLTEAGESLQACSLHCQYFMQLAEAAEPRLYSNITREFIDSLQKDQDNFRVALERAGEQDIESALRIVYSLQMFWVMNANQVQGRLLAEAVIAHAEALPGLQGQADSRRKLLIARALSSLIAIVLGQGDIQYVSQVAARCDVYARAVDENGLLARSLAYQSIGRLSVGEIQGVEAWSRQALEYARLSRDDFALGLSLGACAEYLMITDQDPETAQEYARQSANILLKAHQQWGYALVLLIIGLISKYKGDFKTSRANLEKVLPLFLEMDDTQRVTMIRSEFGHMDRYEGRLDQAEQAYRQTIPVWQKLGQHAAVANTLESLAFIASAHAQGQRAARLLGAAEALREKVSIPMSQFEQVEYDQQIDRLRQSMDEAAFLELWSQGRRMTIEQAVQLAVN